MTLGPDSYVSCIWFVEGEGADFLANTYRDADGWHVEYRVREYNSDDPFDEEDKKYWTQMNLKPGADPIAAVKEANEGLDKMTADLVAAGLLTGPIHKVVVEGDGERAVELLKQQPWAHWQELKGEKAN